LRGFIGGVEYKKFFGLIYITLFLLVSYSFVFIEKHFLFFEDFNIPQFSKGGPSETVIDPTYMSPIVWSLSNTKLEKENDNTFFSTPNISGTNIGTARDGIKQYKVLRGETLKGIASKFSLSIETLKSANPQIKKEIKRGDVITIPPLNGIIYSIQDGDSIDIIADRYEISENLIKQFNSNYVQLFTDAKGTIFLPYAKQKGTEVAARELKNLADQYVLPAVGWNWGEIHKENAVDIANKCGTSVVASADGVVIKDDELGSGKSGWNNGYGVFVLMEHTNGIKTRYAHLDEARVDIGDVVSRGQVIGTMGSTGNTETVNGCHVHFEVLGAKNPFAIK